jgi:hypothetical protein
MFHMGYSGVRGNKKYAQGPWRVLDIEKVLYPIPLTKNSCATPTQRSLIRLGFKNFGFVTFQLQ